MKKLAGSAPPPVPEADAPAPETFTVAGAARALGISRTKLYELLQSGELPSLTIGRRRLVRVASARQLLVDLEHAGNCRRRQARPKKKPAGANRTGLLTQNDDDGRAPTPAAA
jgi:excisionase family DNA binding protein